MLYLLLLPDFLMSNPIYMKKHIIQLIILLFPSLIIINLTGCASAVFAATDPRSIATVTSDQYIKRNLAIKYMDKEFESDHIFVETYDHEVLLTGQAYSFWQRRKILNLAREMDGVTKVYDYLSISTKYDSTASNDTWITGKVKSNLFGTEDVNSNDVKVVTNNSVVYLFGIIHKSQQHNILNSAKSIDGVKKVVPIFHYKSSDTKLNLPGSNS